MNNMLNMFSFRAILAGLGIFTALTITNYLIPLLLIVGLLLYSKKFAGFIVLAYMADCWFLGSFAVGLCSLFSGNGFFKEFVPWFFSFTHGPLTILSSTDPNILNIRACLFVINLLVVVPLVVYLVKKYGALVILDLIGLPVKQRETSNSWGHEKVG